MGDPSPPPGWSPELYDDLTERLEARKRKYLRILVAGPGPPNAAPQDILAMYRRFLVDREVIGDPTYAWQRLRQPVDQEWRGRVTEADKTRAGVRSGKPYLTVWTDDPIVRVKDHLWPLLEEDVNNVVARLAVLGPPPEDHPGLTPHRAPGPDELFPKPFGISLRDVDRPMPCKVIIQAILELRIGRPKPEGEDSIKEVLLDHGRQVLAEDPVYAVRAERALDYWVSTLHVPAEDPTKGEWQEVAPLVGQFPGYDPGAILRAYGPRLAVAIFALQRAAKPKGKALADLLAWIAMTATRPGREALIAVADLQTREGIPEYDGNTGSWKVTYVSKNLNAPPDLPDSNPGKLFARLLSCLDKDGRLCFRYDTSIGVPKDWAWPTIDEDGIYWWQAVLRPNCGEHLLKLKETADFKVTDLLRFVKLHDLFGPRPDPRVPAYVIQCIRVSLLNFKFWFDEPPAGGHDGGEMTFWSENHQILFHSSELLVGAIFPDEVFLRSGEVDGRPMKGSDHQKRGRERTLRWLRRRLTYGFSEWCSPGYYNEDFPPLLNLVDFAEDEDIRTMAAMVVDRLIFDLARFTCRGSFASSAGRAYFEHKCYGWEQSVGETVEILFGQRGDHINRENTAIALCTSSYEVPEVLLAIGLDRAHLDRLEPFADRSRASVSFEEGKAAGIGKDNPDDVTFWWGLGAYFTNEMREATRRTAMAHDNLKKSPPMNLLWTIEQKVPLLKWFGDLPGSVRSLLYDSATLAVGANVTGGTAILAAFTPFPLSLALGVVTLASVTLTIDAVIHLIGDLVSMFEDAAGELKAVFTGEPPPKPKIPDSALQETLETMLEYFNRGNVLGRANLASFGIGDAMLCSVQNHQPGDISFQKLPWIASLGCDACVWTNAPVTAGEGANITAAGYEFFKHALLLQGGDAVADIAKMAGLANMDDLRTEGLYEWGGSISLPRIAQHRDAALISYEFSVEQKALSKTPTHAWFPTQYFDDVDPWPFNDDLLERSSAGDGTWVFGRKDDGYVALYSARRVQWIRDDRFKDDPSLFTAGKKGSDDPFTSTELRAEAGSNIWICVIGNKTRWGGYLAFKDALRASEVSVSGLGSVEATKCSFRMPAAVGEAAGFTIQLNDDKVELDGHPMVLDEYPLFENRYVEGSDPGVVGWGASSYTIRHPWLEISLEHDLSNGRRTLDHEPVVMAPLTHARFKEGSRMPPPPPNRDKLQAPVVTGTRRRRFGLSVPTR